MNLPSEMSHTVRALPRQEPLPRVLLLSLLLLVLIGMAGTFASVYGARAQVGASRADVRQNTALLEQVGRLERLAAQDVSDHRDRNELLHADLCRLVFDVVQAVPSLASQSIKPCRPVMVPASPR